jgi:hypothetical protein
MEHKGNILQGMLCHVSHPIRRNVAAASADVAICQVTPGDWSH